MTAQGLSRIAGGVALVAVLVIAGLVARSAFRGPEPEFVPQLAGGPATGDMSGYLGRVDRATRTIDVAEDLAGLRRVSLAVTDDTSITVLGRPGGLADLSKDMPVRVFYEVRHDVKYVTALQVNETPAAPPATVAPSTGTGVGGVTDARPADTTPVAESKPPAEARPAGEPRSAGEVGPAPAPKPAAAAKSVADAPPATAGRAAPGQKAVVAATTPPAVPSPPLPATPPAVTPPAPRPASPAAPPPAQPPAARAPSSPPPPVHALAATPPKLSRPVAPAEGVAPAAAAPRRPAEPDVADGTAAIDWLLKESGRR